MAGVEYTPDYLEARGISGPEAVSRALHRILGSMEPMVYDAPECGFSEHEQALLREGGLRLRLTDSADLVAEGAVRFAALVESSLTVDEVAKQLGVTPGRVHQLVSSQALYSFRLDGKRLVPGFQIRDGKPVPNITQVNKVLPKSMHPLGVFNWYHLENVDLFVDEEQAELRSPLAWLLEGRDPQSVTFMARHL